LCTKPSGPYRFGYALHARTASPAPGCGSGLNRPAKIGPSAPARRSRRNRAEPGSTRDGCKAAGVHQLVSALRWYETWCCWRSPASRAHHQKFLQSFAPRFDEESCSMPIRRWLWMPIRIYRAPAPASNDGLLAVVNAVIFTVPTQDVAFVRHVAPSRVPLLVSVTYSHVHAKGFR
jgi:hypothetical protein